MIINSFKYPLLAAASLLLPLSASNAFAQEACGESTCDKGYTCEEGPGACAFVLCEEGADCAPCSSEPVEYCVPMECDSDSDCADYMTCETYPTQDCPEVTPECAVDDSEEECSDKWNAWQAECVDSEISQCTPRWHQECEADADCGDGFTCVPNEQCECSGSSERDEEVTCECTPLDTGWCNPVEQACEEDSDCMDDWTCGENYNQVCESDEDGNFECAPADPAKVCYPPDPTGGTGGVISLAASGGLAESGPAGATVDPIAGDAVATPASAEADVDDDLDLPSSGDGNEAAPARGDSNGNAGDGEEASEQEDRDSTSEDLEEDADSASSSSGGGCSVSKDASNSGAGFSALLLGLGLALTRLRRRAL